MLIMRGMLPEALASSVILAAHCNAKLACEHSRFRLLVPISGQCCEPVWRDLNLFCFCVLYGRNIAKSHSLRGLVFGSEKRLANSLMRVTRGSLFLFFREVQRFLQPQGTHSTIVGGAPTAHTLGSCIPFTFVASWVLAMYDCPIHHGGKVVLVPTLNEIR